MPFFVVGAAVAGGAVVVVAGGAVVVVAGGAGVLVDGVGAAVDDCVAWAAGGVDELDAVEPQAAMPKAVRTSRPAAARWTYLDVLRVMVAP